MSGWGSAVILISVEGYSMIRMDGFRFCKHHLSLKVEKGPAFYFAERIANSQTSRCLQNGQLQQATALPPFLPLSLQYTAQGISARPFLSPYLM